MALEFALKLPNEAEKEEEPKLPAIPAAAVPLEAMLLVLRPGSSPMMMPPAWTWSAKTEFFERRVKTRRGVKRKALQYNFIQQLNLGFPADTTGTLGSVKMGGTVFGGEKLLRNCR
jgi:hypothetical protein